MSIDELEKEYHNDINMKTELAIRYLYGTDNVSNPELSNKAQPEKGEKLIFEVLLNLNTKEKLDIHSANEVSHYFIGRITDLLRVYTESYENQPSENQTNRYNEKLMRNNMAMLNAFYKIPRV